MFHNQPQSCVSAPSPGGPLTHLDFTTAGALSSNLIGSTWVFFGFLSFKKALKYPFELQRFLPDTPAIRKMKWALFLSLLDSKLELETPCGSWKWHSCLKGVHALVQKSGRTPAGPLGQGVRDTFFGSLKHAANFF